jgi:cobalt-zinc-cadmium resistance protein CzcA
MKQALKIAMEKNLVLRNAELELETARSGKRTVVDLDPTRVAYTYGQINTGLDDRFLEIEQDFGSVLTHVQRSGYVKQQIELKQSNLLLTRAELERRIKAVYQQWLFHYSLMNLTSREHGYYSKLVEIAETQFRNGEIDLLERSLLETSFAGLQNELRESERLFAETGTLLQQLLQMNTPLLPADSVQTRLPFTVKDQAVENGLIIQYYNDRYELELANVKLEKSKYFPGLSALYFNQSIDQIAGFSGFGVGMRIPLWFVPQGGRVRQAKLQSEIARNEVLVQTTARDRNLENLEVKIRSYRKQLDYYENTALESSETLIRTANLQLEKQGIEYFEFIGSVSVGMDIRREYFQQLNRYNQAVIELEYLLK